MILPDGYISDSIIEDNWDGILRLATSFKLKYCLPSQAFKRLSSYARQHPLYTALKEYGRMPKTLHLLRFINELEIRQDNRSILNQGENNQKFSSAVFFGNTGEMIFLTREEQLIADACQTLIKSIIICWNYLYLTRLIQQETLPKDKQEIIGQIKNTSPMAWGHICFNGSYDFSSENLKDSFDLLRSQNFSLDLE